MQDKGAEMAVAQHPLARTSLSTRAKLKAENPALSDQALARRYGITAATVRKWRERDCTADHTHRPETLHCTLTPAQEAVAMEVRRTLWLPLDDLLMVVREFLNPKVSRSGLARCMNRHGVNKPTVEGSDSRATRKNFKSYFPGFIHMETKCLPQMADETARQYLLVAIDRATRWVFMRIYADRSDVSSTDFLRCLKANAPMKIEKLLTGNGSEFTDRFMTKAKKASGKHAFDRECALLGIEHRLVEPQHPLSNDMVVHFRGLISDVLATPRFRSGKDLQATLEHYETLYNNYLPQRALGDKTPLQVMRTWCAKRPDLFTDEIIIRWDFDNNQAGLESSQN